MWTDTWAGWDGELLSCTLMVVWITSMGALLGFLWPILLICLLQSSYLLHPSILECVYTHLLAKMEKCKILMKETEKNTSKWENTLCSLIGRINVVKIPTLLKAICRLKAISIKIPMALFTEQVNNPKIWMEWQKTMNGPRSLEEEEKN